MNDIILWKLTGLVQVRMLFRSLEISDEVSWAVNQLALQTVETDIGEYRDADGNIHHHTRAYQEGSGGRK